MFILPLWLQTTVTVFLSVCLREGPSEQKVCQYILSFFCTHTDSHCTSAVIPQQSCFCKNSRDHGLIYSIQMCLAECKRVKPGNREFMIAPLEPENSICVFCFRRLISLHSSIVSCSHATKEFSRGRCARSNKQKTSPKMLVCGVTHKRNAIEVTLK